jgi:hypothetical protein
MLFCLSSNLMLFNFFLILLIRQKINITFFHTCIQIPSYMRTWQLFLIIGALLLCGTQSAEAQRRRFAPKQRFHIGVITGVNLSQVDGDGTAGYNKRGVTAGLQGIALLTPRLNLVTELLYTQKGSQIDYKDVVYSRNKRLLSVNYAEVPFLLRMKLLPVDTELKQIELDIGFSFARLVHSRVDENSARVRHSFSDLELDFERNEINAIVGMQTEVFKNFNLGARANIGVSKFYVLPSAAEVYNRAALLGTTPPPLFFRNYLATIYVSYQLY